MSEEQHAVDLEENLPHIQTGGSAGGACLNRHVGDTPQNGAGNSCSHRWQAYLKMKDDSGLYNWNKYESLSKRKSRIPTAALNKPNGVFPSWYKLTLTPPEKGEWDVKGDNFWVKCYVPYWHEAHHVVPNSTLRNAIADCGDHLVSMIRRGLLKEKYNLNRKVNMIMLPLDKAVSNAIGLPRHRQTAAHQSHEAYSKNVKSELDGILQKLKQKLDAHQKRNYSNVRENIESLSRTLYDAIVNSTSASLDEMTSFEE